MSDPQKQPHSRLGWSPKHISQCGSAAQELIAMGRRESVAQECAGCIHWHARASASTHCPPNLA